ncbi:uncharacterized protein BBOV_IV003480 [Babesia bovis T2Bo]|uniref:Uncharacterized protein n=1 Tax=Babesia bovis TaxID=5865 RepID=A7AVW8_BABBO|nr:uncharacterized protein BBOV_IV003480 [Babesia bovis T2Bo]EDO05944.1 hypothetical protein BBOV_IV003480 [Babesia bovis T2Bo]|eukprot:XP_001609512.1 hypothetical protein [Babesia bovis T2Bo]
MLRIHRESFSLDHYVNPNQGSALLIYDSTTVRYACLTLSQLTNSGFVTAYPHIYKLLDILEKSRETLPQIDIRLLLEVIKSCEAILSAKLPVLRHRSDERINHIANAVRDKSIKCAKYITEHISAVQGAVLPEFATTVLKLNCANKSFTKYLIKEITENAQNLAPQVLIGCLEYLANQISSGINGCYGAVYILLDALAKCNLPWKCVVDILNIMVQINVSHPEFLDGITSALIGENCLSEKDVWGMDTVPSRDICDIMGALTNLSHEHLGNLLEAFISRYSVAHVERCNNNVATRNMNKCNLGMLMKLLKAILTTDPELKGPGQQWVRYIVQRRLPYIISNASAQEIEELFHLLTVMDPMMYHQLITPKSEVQLETKLITALLAKVNLMSPKGLAKVVMWFCTSTKNIPDFSLAELMQKCIVIMCSRVLEMIKMSSYITGKMVSQAKHKDGMADTLVLPLIDHSASLKLNEITDNSQSKFLYDPSLGSNFKYLKLGDSRSDRKNRTQHQQVLGASPPKNALNETLKTSSELAIAKQGTYKPMLHETDLKLQGSGEGAHRLMEVLRTVRQSLCVYHHILGIKCPNLYRSWNMPQLQTLLNFLKVYNLFFTMHAAKFSDLEDQYSLYGIDDAYNTKVKKAIKAVDAEYLDQRFLCTPETRELFNSSMSNSPVTNIPTAKLRNRDVYIAKPVRSKVKLNWNHFDDGANLAYITRSKSPRSLRACLSAKMNQTSQEVDLKLHGNKNEVDYYPEYISKHFKGTVACFANENNTKCTNKRADANVSTSRMHKQIHTTLTTTGTISVASEVRCDPYFIDMVCIRSY